MKGIVMLNINRLRFVGAVLALSAAMAGHGADKKKTPKQPNILLFLADDLGWADVGYNGSTYHLTPNIDKMAAESMVFDGAYMNPSCSPSRASIATGLYPPRHGIYHVEAYARTPEKFMKMVPVKSGHFLTDMSIPTMGELMQKAGYHCGYTGKWHLGETPETLPLGRGFSANAAGCGWGHPPGGYFAPYRNKYLKDGPKGEYLPDRLCEESIRFMKESEQTGKPFFLIHAPYLVHRPNQAKKEDINTFKQRTPDEGRSQPTYAAMVYALDRVFGNLVAELKKEGKLENTVIILTSDNGINKLSGKATPLRGGKGEIYEGGVRVPMLVYWKGKTTAGHCAVPVNGIDLLPTVLELARTELPPVVDGESLVPLFDGKGALKRDAIYWHIPCYNGRPGNAQCWQQPVSALRSGDFKLIYNHTDGSYELYNLVKDVGESKNLAASMPEKVAQLKGKLDAWLKETNAPMPRLRL